MSIIPVLRYADGERAMRFLVDGLGFEVKGDVTRNDAGAIVHAELRRGDDFVMLSDATEATPTEVYVTDSDPDALFVRAIAAGATVTYEPTTRSYGSREFAVKDPEGTTWYVGTYEP